MTLTVGQKLWFVWGGNYRGRAPQEVTVAKVGRKWTTLDNGHRVNVETLCADGKGYMSPGRAWPSREAFEAHKASSDAWDALCQRMHRMHRHAPEGMTVERIAEVTRLLFGGQP